MKIRLSFTLLASLALLAGCSSSELSAPTLPAARTVPAVARSTTLEEIRVANDELCPIDTDGALLVFSGTATGPKDGSRLKVNGVEIEPGMRFETSEQNQIPGGFDCGGQHFEDAIHILREDISTDL